MPNSAGYCPKCGVEMYQKDGFVICPEKDYKAEFSRWDEKWNNFDNSSVPSIKNSQALVKVLLSINLINEEAVGENA